jgi:formate hydrogenlyase transcriptional activator
VAALPSFTASGIGARIASETTVRPAESEDTLSDPKRVEKSFGERAQATDTDDLRRDLELRQILDLLPQHVAVFGGSGEHVYLNPAGLDYHGLSIEEWLASDLWSLFHPEDRDRVIQEGSHQLELGSPAQVEARLRRGDGQYRWFLIRRNPLRDAEGRITRWFASGVDIEDRKQTEERLKHENLALREEIDKTSMFEEIVGTSRPIRRVLEKVSRVAPTDSTVLITGETGTGKELIARAIHKSSPRADRPFVSVNCAAIPPTLIGSELFGHEKGAFTGAHQRRPGRFELADCGTIFLDEVGELALETQMALLRVLQERELERVGGSQTIAVDVRVIAATNRDLKAAVGAHAFRSDLFYRLNVFPIEAPPLRERPEDIPLLVEYFIHRFAGKARKTITSIDGESMDLLQSYAWPGNIRELQNVIERSTILCEGDVFYVDRTWLARSPETEMIAGEKRPLLRRSTEQERQLIEQALAETRGRISGPTGAASRLGVPPTTLESKIRAMGIDKFRFRKR